MARRKTMAAIIGLAGLAVGGHPVAAAAACPDIPLVAWWGDGGHATIRAYVESRHDGDWSAYLDKWERQLARLETVRENANGAGGKAKALRIAGEDIAAYVEQVRRRVQVIRCLADESRDAASLGKASPG